MNTLSFIQNKPAPKALKANPFLPGKPVESDLPKDSLAPSNGFVPSKPPVLEPGRTIEAPAPKPEANLSLEALNSSQQAALSALPGPAAAALRSVWNEMESTLTKTHLLSLLEGGTLGQKDQVGTVAERLQTIMSTPRATGYDGEALTSQTIALLAEPETNTFQGNRFTCAAANLMCQLADNPPLLTQLVDELSDPEGTIPLAPDTTLVRLKGTEADDGSGRNDVNRLLQGSLMQLAGAKAHGDYDPVSDRFQDGGMGLKSLDLARATAKLTGVDQVVVFHRTESHKAFEKLIKETPPGETIQLGAYWQERDHMLLLLKQEDGMAEVFDPLESKTTTLPLDKLLFKTELALFPAHRVDEKEVPEGFLYFPDRQYSA